MTDNERLSMMVNVLLSGVVLIDAHGKEYTVTGFKDDGRTALLSRLAPPRRCGRGKEVFPNNPMEVQRLDGFTVKGRATA